MKIEDKETMQPFISQLEEWGCQVLQAINRPNPYRGGFSIVFRCEEDTARAIADIGLVNILLDLRANTYQLRLPEVLLGHSSSGQPELMAWTEESKRERLDDILTLWNNTPDIIERRKSRLGLFHLT